jgi:hypothetical protein
MTYSPPLNQRVLYSHQGGFEFLAEKNDHRLVVVAIM